MYFQIVNELLITQLFNFLNELIFNWLLPSPTFPIMINVNLNQVEQHKIDNKFFKRLSGFTKLSLNMLDDYCEHPGEMHINTVTNTCIFNFYKLMSHRSRVSSTSVVSFIIRALTSVCLTWLTFFSLFLLKRRRKATGSAELCLFN